MSVGKNEGQSFEAVYESNYPVLLRVAYHITGRIDIAEDMVQETFIRYYNRGQTLPDMNQTRYWLIRVVKNLCYNSQKRKGREKRAYNRLEGEPVKPEETGEEKVLKEETRQQVQVLLKKLPYKLRTVMVLKEYADLSYKDIGKILKISEGNVKVRVFRARAALENLMDKEGVYVP